MKYFDTHAHYNDKAFDENREEILNKCKAENVEYIVNVGASVMESLECPNACVTSIMEYANNKVFGGTVNEGAYILYYTQTYNSNPLIDGVSLDYIEPFVTHFFKTQTFTNYKSAIDAKHPVMTDVNSQIESSAHNVLCVGYNSNTGAAIYMDPELACMYSVNAGYFLQDYNIVLTGIK